MSVHLDTTRTCPCAQSAERPGGCASPTSHGERRRHPLLRGDLTGIVNARHLSQATMSNIRQNLVFAFIYNVAGIPLAAGVLYPTFGLLLSPVIAAAAMALSSVSVITDALRLRPKRP